VNLTVICTADRPGRDLTSAHESSVDVLRPGRQASWVRPTAPPWWPLRRNPRRGHRPGRLARIRPALTTAAVPDGATPQPKPMARLPLRLWTWGRWKTRRGAQRGGRSSAHIAAERLRRRYLSRVLSRTGRCVGASVTWGHSRELKQRGGYESADPCASPSLFLRGVVVGWGCPQPVWHAAMPGGRGVPGQRIRLDPRAGVVCRFRRSASPPACPSRTTEAAGRAQQLRPPGPVGGVRR
jgi:hypothetical protein